MPNQPTEKRVVSCLLVCLLGGLVLIAGCGGSASYTGGPTPSSGAGLNGKLRGGQYPVKGAAVQLYAAGSSGYGSGATALLAQPVLTDSNGNFFIPTGGFFDTPGYTCPSAGALTYLVATGGDPGLGADNAAIALMTPLGACAKISSLPAVMINEVTTVASAWALSAFMGPGGHVGASSTNAQGLANAFANFGNLATLSNGTSPGVAAPAGATVPVSKINTLANILATCVNSNGSAACAPLFAAATPAGGSAPANTLDAALNIARNPAANVAALFNIPAPLPPFGPSLSVAPSDWTLAVSYTGGGLNLPASIAVDAAGNVWTTNYCQSNPPPCSSVTELSSNGQALSPSSGFASGKGLWETFGLSIDLNGSVWVASYQTSSVNGGNGNLVVLNSSGSVVSGSSGYSGGGVFFPAAVATDTDGSVWTANQGHSTATKLTNSGLAISSSSGWGSGAGGLAGPVAVAIDAIHGAWFANASANSGSVTRISSDGRSVVSYASGGAAASGIATDAIGLDGTFAGHTWVANYSSGTVSELQLKMDGTATVVSTGYTGGGLSGPNGIAVDGAGNVWAANFHGLYNAQGKQLPATISELQGASGSNPGQALSPSAGFGADAGLLKPYGIAIDASGNIWVSNNGSSSITQFLGAATPVKTPLIATPQLP